MEKHTQDMEKNSVPQSAEIKKEFICIIGGKMNKKLKKKSNQIVLQKNKEQEIETINNKLQLSFIMDLKKPNVNKFERAQVLQHYMKRNLISFKEMCEQLHIGKTTLSGWLKWANLTEAEYASYKDEGMTETEITNLLKGTTSNQEGLLVTQIKATMKTLSRLRSSRSLHDDTWNLIKELRNKLNYLLYQAEKNGDRK